MVNESLARVVQSVTFTDQDAKTIGALAITAASLSILAGLPMLYWFARLRKRTFRHQLIMCLIFADFCKAICEFVYPAATITSGTTDNSVFCETIGFFTAIFVNAADFAILLIAAHTAISIFKPIQGVTAEHSGLYPWRHAMYASLVVYSILLASLAFLNVNRPYTTAVSWCYLPFRPYSWRVALSWGPRYIILSFILVLYVAVFVFVRIRFSSIQALFLTSSSSRTTSCDDLPSHTVLEVHESPSLLVAELDTHQLLTPREPEHDDQYSKSTEPANDKIGLYEQQVQPKNAIDVSVIRPPNTRQNTGLNSCLEYDEIPTLTDPMLAERLRIIKKLRLLFIFPFVYFMMWIVPFVYHTLQYNDKYLTNPIIGTSFFSGIIIPLHGFIDVVVYAGGEKPWRSLCRRTDVGTMQETENSRNNFLSVMRVADPTDAVAKRYETELQEAAARRMQRGQTTSSQDWWDLEIAALEQQDESRL